MNGGLGNDSLVGDSGTDVFLFKYSAHEGADEILDYTDGTDKIRSTNTGGSVGFGDLVLTNIGADCQISLASGTIILIEGVSSAALDAGDFIFN